jgi:2,3,4,5-tetrahydropyridine-2-carboxylate N-succinyltransferase
MNEAAIEAMPQIDNIALVRIRNKEDNVIGLIPNIPGKQKSLRLYNGLSVENGILDRNGIAYALSVFGDDLIAKTRENPAKHPNIALLLNTPEGDALKVERVTTKNAGLLERYVAGKATTHDKIEGMQLLEAGKIRTAEPVNGVWQVQMYAVDAMNGVFSIKGNAPMGNGFYDKVSLLTANWSQEQFDAAGVRFIPGSFARSGAYIGKGTVLMPGSIVNTGSYIAGDSVMIDGGARVATGAQLGKRVKLGAGSGIEGILEPKGMLPTILEDDVRVGANCELKGLIGRGAAISSGVVMASGVKIFDERTNEFMEPLYMQVGEEFHAIPHIPAGRVAVPGVYFENGGRKTSDGKYTGGGTCIRLLEKEASATKFATLPKNANLYN